MSELEDDFASIAQKINAKLKESAELLKEIDELRRKAKLPSLIATMYVYEELCGVDDKLRDEIEYKLNQIDVYGLEKELKNLGWNPSSNYC